MARSERGTIKPPAGALPSEASPRRFDRLGRRGAAVLLVLSSMTGAGCSNTHETGVRSLQFLDQGKPVASRTLEQLARLVEPRDVEVFDPHQLENLTYEAFSLPELLDEVYGTGWRQREALVFFCRDGYEPTIPVRRVLRHRAFLAFDRPGANGFTLLEHRNGAVKPVDLGPFYLIWGDLDDTKMRAADGNGWPYQVERIDLASFRSRFGEMVPDRSAPSEVWAGFDAFVMYCSKCHTINGEGGKVGPELNYPANPTEYMTEPWLKRWIADPTSMRSAPTMPPLDPLLPDRAHVIDEIVAYLRAISSHKTAPAKP